MADALPAADDSASGVEGVTQDWRPLLLAGGAVAAVGVLVILFGLLRRL